MPRPRTLDGIKRRKITALLIYGWMDTHLLPPEATATRLVKE